MAVLALLLVAGCERTLISDASCELPCYEAPLETLGVGVCHAGEPVCEGKKWIECRGQVVPTPEICNGLDDDCDGHVDESDPQVGRSCGTSNGVCSPGFFRCQRGQLECDADTPPSPEICNGIDDDCDGDVDNLPALTFCYSAAPDTAGVGPCSPGVQKCNAGVSSCVNEVVPSPEICNGVNDDCDEWIDEDFVGADIVALTDISNSITNNDHAWAAGLIASLVADSEGTNTRWSVGTFPDAFYGTYWRLTQGTGPEALAATPDRFTTRSPLQFEYSYDAVFEACERADLWRPEKGRYILLFADEAGQTRRNFTATDVRDMCDGRGVEVWIYTRRGYEWSYEDVGLVQILQSTAEYPSIDLPHCE